MSVSKPLLSKVKIYYIWVNVIYDEFQKNLCHPSIVSLGRKKLQHKLFGLE